MTECLTSLCNSCFTKVGEELYVSIKRQICYLIQCKRYVEELTNKVDELSTLREHLQLSVDKACSNGDDISLVLQRWMTRVKEFEDRVKEMTNRDKKNMKCLKGWHPNCSSRYRLGKEAKTKINVVKNLQDEGRKFSPAAFVALRPPPVRFEDVPRGDFEANKSSRSTMERIMKALKDDNISIIGVFGMGGVGKTTLVEEVGKQVSTEKLFKVVMVTVSQNYSVIEIQEEIAENLSMKLEEKSSNQRKAKLFSRLKQETNILLILDDLWKELELGEVGIPIGEDHKGCKIVLTSRNKDLCKRMKCQEMIEVNVLSEKDSWELFKTNVGDVADSLELHSIAQDVAKECGGLPLAIVTVGQSMRNNNDLMIWNDLLLQLKSSDPITIDGISDKVFPSIAFSFNRLESKEIKLCFLFCCLFPEDYEIDVNVLTFYGRAEGFIKGVNTLEQARGRVHTFVKYLKDRGLLLDGRKEGCVKLHDVVRDVAIWIASKDEYKFLVKARAQMENVKAEEWQGCKRVSQTYSRIASVDNEMPGNQNQGLLTLLLQSNYSLKKLPGNMFEGMKSLVVLDLSGTSISTLPPSFPCLVSLRMLCLDYCEYLEDVSQLRGVRKLLTLHLRSTGIHALTEEIGELTNLIFLDLRNTRWLKTIAPNVISRLVYLQELCMSKSFSGWDLCGSNASLVEVCSLTHLTSLTIDIDNIECLSIDLERLVKNLSTFRICVNYEFTHGESSDMFRYRRVLGLGGISEPLSHLSFVLLKNTEALSFASCENDSFDCLRKIISGPLPTGIFGELKFLHVTGCPKLVIILTADVLMRMQNLKEVNVTKCDNVQVIFNVEGINRGEIVHSKLRELFLYGLPQLICIWKGVVPPEILHNIEKIDIGDCGSMRSLFSLSVAKSLKKLERLLIFRCWNIENLISDAELPPNLISDEELPPSPSIGQIAIFQNLRRLHLTLIRSLKCVFPLSVAQGLLHLESLELVYLYEMEEVISMEDGEIVDQRIFPQLKELTLWKLYNLKWFYRASVVLGWPSLEYIHVFNCSELKRLPIGLQSAPKLSKISAEKEWFEGVEWEDDSVKKRLQTLLEVLPPYSDSEATTDENSCESENDSEATTDENSCESGNASDATNE